MYTSTAVCIPGSVFWIADNNNIDVNLSHTDVQQTWIVNANYILFYHFVKLFQDVSIY